MIVRILLLVLFAALATILALYVIPLFIPQPVDPHGHETYTPPVEQQGDAPAHDSDPIIPQGDIEQGDQSDQQGEPAQPDTPEDTDEPAQPDTPGNTDEVVAPQSSYSTTDRPVIQDFAWFEPYTEAPIPQGAQMRTSFADVEGGWKAYIVSEPSVDGAGAVEELLNVYIEGGEDDAEVTLDWYWSRNEKTGDTWENTGDDIDLTAFWSDEMLFIEGPEGRMVITSFWYIDGHEYAIGRAMWSDGSEATVALFR